MTIAYLSNSFPEPLEPYVWEEIHALRKRGVRVLPCSIKRPRQQCAPELALQTLYAFPLHFGLCLKATWACARYFSRIREIVWRAIRGPEPISRRLRALAHTWLGVYLATVLRNNNVGHIHVHHGYFASWAAMVAARVLNARFSMTLHGSDLLVRADYLDIKLRNCKFCFTISEFNRCHILHNYPECDPSKILVQGLGIDTAEWDNTTQGPRSDVSRILSVGRLHAVKNHAFLILACRAMKSCGVKFRCSIAGEGEERGRLQELICALDLSDEVKLLGHVPREQLPHLYRQADLVVLTSRSEGIPVTLMEAMSMERLVLGPNITGIPELVKDGQTGFLYQPNSMEEFLQRIQFLLHAGGSLGRIRKAARAQIERNFNGKLNLEAFAKTFVNRVSASKMPLRVLAAKEAYEDSVLQQVQLSV